MGLADVPLVLILHVARLALALVVAGADAVEAGNVTLGLALGQLAVPFEARGAFTDVRANASSILAGSGKEIHWTVSQSHCSNDKEGKETKLSSFFL